MSEENLEQTFKVGSPARLKLSNIRGSVEILPGEDGLLTVTAAKYADTGLASRTKITMSQTEEGMVIVETKHQDAWWAFFTFSQPCRVDYQVRIPPQCEIDISCVSSSMTVQKLTGKFKFSTVSGSISLESLNGEMKVTSVSGEVSGVKLAGPLLLNTVSGEVRMKEASLPSADLTTVSGEMRLQTELTTGPYRFHSVSGAVWLSVPPETRCSLELQSISGGLHVNMPVTRQKSGGGHSSIDVQGGGVRVTANSVSGGVFVETLGGNVQDPEQRASAVDETAWQAQTPQPPQPPVPPLAPEPAETTLDRTTVLDRIEKGEMTVEEGLKALEKLA
jgi:hypothetical protein